MLVQSGSFHPDKMSGSERLLCWSNFSTVGASLRLALNAGSTYITVVVSDKGDLVDLSFKGSRSGLALLASVSFKMEFRIPILSQEAYSDTQRESTLENFEVSRLESKSAQQANDSDRLRWRAEATVLSPTVFSPDMTLRVCVHK